MLWHTEAVGESSIISILIIAIGLSADCFAVAVSGGISMTRISSWQMLRVSLSFGLFQALMPVIGWIVGKTFVDLIASFDHWLAFALLVIIGGRMIYEAFHHDKSDRKKTDISKGFALLILSVATSIDALAVGLTFAFINVNILIASLIIGVVASTITWIGFHAGKLASSAMGKHAELAGGIILTGIGIRILLTHIL